MSRAAELRWTPTQDAIVRATYPTKGSLATIAALERAGYPTRSRHAVSTRANLIGLALDPDAEITKGRGRTDKGARAAILALIRDYRGMPLSTLDVVDEIDRLSPARARKLLDQLTKRGLLAAREIDGNVTVWYDPHAEKEEAA